MKVRAAASSRIVGRTKESSRTATLRAAAKKAPSGSLEGRVSAQPDERAFAFLEINRREEKPRTVGLTEIRGPYYTPMGRRYLEDLLETMGAYVDSLKFAGGSFALMTRKRVRELIELADRFQVEVSTGGFIEHVLTRGASAVAKYIAECADLGFDTVEISAGFITIPTDDWLRLIKKVRSAGLKAKPEVGIRFGAGGATEAA